MERRILMYAARALYALLVVIETTQAVRKIREAFGGFSKK